MGNEWPISTRSIPITCKIPSHFMYELVFWDCIFLIIIEPHNSLKQKARTIQKHRYYILSTYFGIVIGCLFADLEEEMNNPLAKMCILLLTVLALIAFSNTSEARSDQSLPREGIAVPHVAKLGYFKLFALNLEGGIKQLTFNGGNDYYVSVSPDGKMLAYSKQQNGEEYVFLKPVEGGTERQLSARSAKPEWLHNEAVVVESFAGKSDRDIVVVNTTTGGTSTLVGGGTYDVQPARCGPSKVVFKRGLMFPEEYIWSTDTVNTSQALAESGFWPHCSGDGTQLLYTYFDDTNGSYNVRVVDVDGNTLATITKEGYELHRGRFSPDGAKIVLMATTSGGSKSYVLVYDSQTQTLSEPLVEGVYPSWMGNQIVFSTFTTNIIVATPTTEIPKETAVPSKETVKPSLPTRVTETRSIVPPQPGCANCLFLPFVSN